MIESVRPSPRKRPRAVLAIAIAALALVLASCAPHLVQPPELAVGTRENRYLAALAAREHAAVAVEADLVVWAELGGDRDLPGVQARLLLASPDAFRLRVQSPLGTALDFGGVGDSLTAYVPPRRAGMRLERAGDSLHVHEPARFLVRGLSATWRPPPEAWRSGVARDSLLETRWQEGDDSLVVAVGTTGLPAVATVSRDGGGVRVRYLAWDGSGGTSWPSRVEIEDLEGRGRVTCRIRNLRFPPALDRSRLVVRMPEEATHVTLADVRRMFERLSAF